MALKSLYILALVLTVSYCSSQKQDSASIHYHEGGRTGSSYSSGESSGKLPSDGPRIQDITKSSGLTLQKGILAGFSNQPSLTNTSTKLIKKVNITLVIKDYTSWKRKLIQFVEIGGAYISSSRLDVSSNTYKSGSIVIRVPKEQLDGLLDQIKTLGKLTSENIQSDDITGKYTDLKARIHNKKLTETRFQEILKGKASKTTDILAVEKELGRIREEIDRMTRQLNRYDQLVDFSTITLYFRESEEKRVEGESFWVHLRENIAWALNQGLEGLLGVINGIIIFLIAGIPVWIVLYFGRKYLIKWLRKRKETKS
ncbi:MAG TPA: DUF4349 domain-containing protein [Spirochaetes bacterium]|nr:DUF4349 domain-containing protein [Spirochaetota bacterium]